MAKAFHKGQFTWILKHICCSYTKNSFYSFLLVLKHHFFSPIHYLWMKVFASISLLCVANFPNSEKSLEISYINVQKLLPFGMRSPIFTSALKDSLVTCRREANRKNNCVFIWKRKYWFQSQPSAHKTSFPQHPFKLKQTTSTFWHSRVQIYTTNCLRNAFPSHSPSRREQTNNTTLEQLVGPSGLARATGPWVTAESRELTIHDALSEDDSRYKSNNVENTGEESGVSQGFPLKGG